MTDAMIIDTNVNFSSWPFRHLPGSEPAESATALRRQKVSQAWVGTIDGIFHRDVSGANARLAEACQAAASLFIPFGSINPKLPDWQEDLRRCCEVHRMRGIRLHPNYHGYKLSDAVFRELVRLAAERKIVVQLALCMEDERTQHPLMRVPPVDLLPLSAIVQEAPNLRLQVLNCFPQLKFEQLQLLASSTQVSFEISMAEGIGVVGRWIQQLGLHRIVFGSHYPLFSLESAFLKLQEAGLDDSQRKAVLQDNAMKLLA